MLRAPADWPEELVGIPWLELGTYATYAWSYAWYVGRKRPVRPHYAVVFSALAGRWL